ncbi:Outer membrane lipoprotein-sorting protein [Fontibacillus panacisegetis]|uniref:Outer membrane lipoprotein-sorting protein n=1 Tax=Fontibacillus panacisegetis TaxID=670482 RepID=A0A1G7NMJ2_9BACL|nr:outer membrane lipoprotein-sorting protein [Fontibacillus panacisegetis]SDF75202.1 Outer membrane lipoprotein-sorting protein [Fontibacillus panacisegetis]
MRRITMMLTIVIVLSMVLAACGKKDAAGVVKDLDKVVTKLESYQGAGTMTLYTGDKPQEYKVEVWYQNPSFYRIALTNAEKDVTQIVLRNEQGVYVLTPSLNKSFRFQSDWPENQGQVYLYQTLVRSILSDNSRQFVDDKESYVFEVAANYNTHALVRQKIWLAKNDYAPKQVQVSDAQAKVVVEVKFDKFDFDAKFDNKSFDMQHNLDTAARDSQGTMLEVDENGMLVEKSAAGTNGSNQEFQDDWTAQGEGTGEPVAGPEGSDSSTAQSLPALSDPFGVIIPTYLPDGVVYKDDKVVDDSERSLVLLRYDGTYQFTLSESRSPDRTASLVAGELVDLGFTAGLLTGEQLQTLTWTIDGLEFRITSDNLPLNEMAKIAASMQDQTGK